MREDDMSLFQVMIIVPFYKCPTHYSYSYFLFLLHKFDSLFRVFLLNHVFILFSLSFHILCVQLLFQSSLCSTHFSVNGFEKKSFSEFMVHCSLSLKLQRLIVHALCLHGLAVGADIGQYVNETMKECQVGKMVEGKSERKE